MQLQCGWYAVMMAKSRAKVEQSLGEGLKSVFYHGTSSPKCDIKVCFYSLYLEFRYFDHRYWFKNVITPIMNLKDGLLLINI
jgi:hypothetical protein